MEQIALYRKYRPHNFDNLVGQDHIKTTLVNALKANHVSHAYLFSGPRGTGKTSAARLLAKALICNSLVDDHDPCNECEFCVDINEGKLIDLIEIDAASNRGIDEVRDLKEKINFAPTRAKYKVYIIDEVHMMTNEAFNALLKTLEEPPPHAYFILATTEIHKIPETIISRCQRFDFRRISQKALMTRLSYIAQVEEIKAEDKALETIAKYVDGGLRDAIGLLEQLTTDNELLFERVQEVLGISDHSLLDKLYDTLLNTDTKEALRIIHELHDQGSDLIKFTHEFIANLRDKMLLSISKKDHVETDHLMKIIDVFQEAQTKIHSSNIPQLPLEMAVIRISGPVVETQNSKLEENKESNEEKSDEIEEKALPPQEKHSKENMKSAPSDSEKSFEINFDLKSLNENWPRITERVKSPSLRMSLKNALPIKIEGPELTLQFNTKFHKSKVMEHDHRVELEKIIKDITNHPAKILSIVKELEIKPVIEGTEKDFDQEDEEDDMVDQALNIFGGEIVD